MTKISKSESLVKIETRRGPVYVLPDYANSEFYIQELELLMNNHWYNTQRKWNTGRKNVKRSTHGRSRSA